MPQEVLVLGHRNPDTDAIASALGYAWLKNRLWEREADSKGAPGPDLVAVAACLGPPNPETAFALTRFGLEPPRLVADLHLRVTDVIEPVRAQVGPGTTLLEVGRLMQEIGRKSVAVTEADGSLVGMVSAGDIARKYLEERSLLSLAESPVTVANLEKTLSAELVVGQPDLAIHGKVAIAAMSPESLRRYVTEGDLLIVGDRPRAQEAALALGVAALVVTGGYPVSERVAAVAKARGAAILRTDHDTYTAARLLNMSQPVGPMMSRQVVSFAPSDRLEDARKVMVQTKFRRYPVIDERGRLTGMLSRSGLLDTHGKTVILVDHNERSQAAEGIDEAEVLEVVDHHRLGDLTTVSPILVRNEPVGSTATIVTQMFREEAVELPPALAGVLLSAVISDTLGFKSPTATGLDRETAQFLAARAGVDLDEYAKELLCAGTTLAGQHPREIVREDFKEFSFGGRRVGVSQVEVMEMDEIEALAGDLRRELADLAAEQGYALVLLMVTDLWRGGSTLFAAGPEAGLVEAAFGRPLEGQEVYLPGVLSRKKQVIPPLARAFAMKEL